MARLRRMPLFVMRLMRFPPRLVYAVGLGRIMGRLVLLLTTRGRKSGRQHITPLQFEIDQNRLLIGSMRGKQADWYRNIIADPHVAVRWGVHQFEAVAEAIHDPEKITDYLEMRLAGHPRMIGSMLRAEGLAPPWTREKLGDYARQIAIIAIPLPREVIENETSRGM